MFFSYVSAYVLYVQFAERTVDNVTTMALLAEGHHHNNIVALLQCASWFNWLFNESDLQRSESYMYLVFSLADLSRPMMGKNIHDGASPLDQCFQYLCARASAKHSSVNTVHTEKHGLYCTDTYRDYLKRKVAPNMILARRRSYFLQMGTKVPPSRSGTPIPVKHSEP